MIEQDPKIHFLLREVTYLLEENHPEQANQLARSILNKHPESWLSLVALYEQAAEKVPMLIEDTSFDFICYQHPDKETHLRCYKPECENPICSKCATYNQGVGYLCHDCAQKTTITYRVINEPKSELRFLALPSLFYALPIIKMITWFANLTFMPPKNRPHKSTK